ncbi:MAG: hypothetical protein ACFE0O_05340 [Opitutales bacterium]
MNPCRSHRFALSAIIALLAVPFPLIAQPAPEDPIIELDRVMSPEQQAAAGVDTLSADQRAYLEAWLAGFVSGLTRGPYVGDAIRNPANGDDEAIDAETFGLEKEKEEKEKGPLFGGFFDFLPNPLENKPALESRLVGEFTGWKQGQRFVLENGQVWEQTSLDNQRYRKKTNPPVQIREVAGDFKLYVDGGRSAVKVERIK